MTEHGQAGQGGKHSCNAEIFIAVPELFNRSFLIRVTHEIDIPFENLRVELQRILDRGAIFGIIFVAQHVHERGVVHAVHSQRADEIPFEQPERFGKQ